MDPFSSALELADAVRRKEVSPTELVDLYLERADRLDPQVNAFCLRDDDSVNANAEYELTCPKTQDAVRLKTDQAAVVVDRCGSLSVVLRSVVRPSPSRSASPMSAP